MSFMEDIEDLVDFDDFDELNELIEEASPHVLSCRLSVEDEEVDDLYDRVKEAATRTALVLKRANVDEQQEALLAVRQECQYLVSRYADVLDPRTCADLVDLIRSVDRTLAEADMVEAE